MLTIPKPHLVTVYQESQRDMKVGNVIVSPEVATLAASAAKCTVRECDETEKGHFVAYVDERKDSWDVSVQFDASGNAESFACDCGGPLPCRHVAALILFLTKGATTGAEKLKVKKVKAAKKSASDVLLDELDAAAMSDWLRKVFPLNKELELAFIHHFSGRNKTYTPTEVKELTINAVKTVLKRSNKADATQMKKILELWKELHEPIIERYLGGPADEDAFLSLNALFNTCLGLMYSVHVVGKTTAYVQRILESLIPNIAALAQAEAFERAAGFFIDRISEAYTEAGMAYATMIKDLSEVCSPARRIVLARRVAKQFSGMHKAGSKVANPAFAAAALSIVEGAGLFNEYYTIFQPIRWSNDYNLALIRALVSSAQTGLAEDYAWAQINGNSNSDYNAKYLELLEELYMQAGNEQGLIKIARILLPDTFNFDHYRLILSHMPDEAERKAFRQTVYTRARHARGRNRAAGSFSIQVLAYEEKWMKIIEFANESTTSYGIILQHLNHLMETNKKLLLKNLLQGIVPIIGDWRIGLIRIWNLWRRLRKPLLMHVGRMKCVRRLKAFTRPEFIKCPIQI